MWAFFSVIVLCITFLVWSHRYIIPVSKEPKSSTAQDIPDNQQPFNFDEIIADINNSMEEE